MIYVIKRETDMPFEGSVHECSVKNDVYDILVQPKNTGLDNISEFVIDDNMVFVKADPRYENSIRTVIEKKFGPMKDLLYG